MPVDQYFDETHHGSPFLSFLDWLNNTEQFGLNVLKGNPLAAARHATDFLSGPLRAVIPGDHSNWTLSRPEDEASVSQMMGIDREKHPFLAKGADLLGVAADPITYLSLGAGGLAKGAAIKGAEAAAEGAGKTALRMGLPFTKISAEVPGSAAAIQGVKDVAQKGFEALPESVQQAGETIGRKVRATFGEQRLSPEKKAIQIKALAAGANEAKAGLDASREAMKGLSLDEQNIVGDVIDNLRWQDGKPVARLAPDGVSAVDRVALHPEVTPENIDRIRNAVQQTLEIGRNQAKYPGIFKSVTGADGKPIEMNPEYLQRQWSGMTDAEREAEALGNPSALKGRSLNTPEDVIGALQDNPDLVYERNAVKRLARRSEEQGKLAQRAEIGRAILGEGYAHADPEMKGLVEKTIEGLPPEESQVLMDSFKGLPGRMKGMQWIASANRLFKPAAVYGAFFPKVGSIIRNKIGGVWQALANPESRSTVAGQIKRIPTDLADAFTQSFGPNALKAGELSKKLELVDQAFAHSGGSSERAFQLMSQADPDLAAVVKSGALEGFVSSEDLINEMARTGWKKQYKNIAYWPGKVFKGVEDRMRLGMALDLMKSGKTPEEAARITRDALYDYTVSSKENRAARDLIPFFQFQAKAIPQSAKFMAEQPSVASALGTELHQDPGDPVYPYMEGRLNLPMGNNQAGGRDFISGLGLPFEGLNLIPGSFRDVKRNVIGSMSPPLKALFGRLSGEDPYFETPIGSYDKMPVVGDAGEAGKAYNALADAGLIQPLDSPLRLLDQAVDPRRDLGTKAIDLLSGANVVSVDPDLALQQQLTEALKENPDVRQYRGFYADAKDEPTAALIRAYQAAKQKVKAKRHAGG